MSIQTMLFPLLLCMGMILCGTSMAHAQESDDSQPREHPYLYFSAEEIPALRERVQQDPYAVRWETLRSNADSILNQGVARSTRDRTGNAATSAFAYVITGDERYGRRAIAEVMDTISQDYDFWAKPLHYNRGANLGTSELAFGVGLVYDWCHDLLTEEQKQAIVEALEEKAMRPYLISTDEEQKEWWYRHEMNNWRGVCHGGLGVASLAIYHESDLGRRAAEISYENVPLIFDQFVRKDSGGFEGIGYHNYGMVYASYALMAQQRFFGGHEQVFEDMTDKLAGYWDVYTQGPDLFYANIGRTGISWQAGLWGDRRGQYEGGPNAELCALYESWVDGGDELLLWAADNGGVRHYWRGAAPLWFMFRRPDAPSRYGQPKPELQPAVLFRGNGHAVLRSPDEDAPRSLWLAYSGGRNHNAGDLGSYVLVVGDERFVHMPEVNRNDTQDQSTLLINGNDQAHVREGDYHRFGSGEGFHYLASDLSNVYEDDTLERFVRHLVMVNGDVGGYIVILDDLAASEPAEFESRVQTTKDDLSTESSAGKIVGDSATLHILTAGSEDLEIRLGEKLMNFFTVNPGRPAETTTLVTVLYPTAPDGEAPAVSFEDGTVTVGEDTLTFARDNGLWMLQTVNGSDATDIPTGDERMIEPLRPIE